MEKGKDLDRMITKIEWEYEKFYNILTCSSRAELIARAGEIDKKKRIVKVLKSMIASENDETIQRLLLVENLVEEAYRFYDQNPEKGVRYSVEKTISFYR